MTEASSNPVSVRGRFHRSVQLSADFDAGATGYVLTPTATTLTSRISDELALHGGVRAWSVTGPYGTGKSAFALYLTRLLSGCDEAHTFENLPVLTPALVVGRRKSIKSVLLTALATTFESTDKRFANKLKKLEPEHVSNGELSTLFETAVEKCVKNGTDGLVLVIDEFGKLLEYAAANPETEDLLIMQTLAEVAARSEQKLLILTILHTSFDAYLTGADEARRAEWRKVQGRYTDVAFLEPPEQLLRLINTALSTQFSTDLELRYKDILEVGLTQNVLVEAAERLDIALLSGCAPLHPVTALLLWPLFRSKLAQNERSLFSFLTSDEPDGFQSFLRSANWQGELPHYHPARLYDYVMGSLGAGALRGLGGRKWSEVEAALERVRADAPPLTQDVVKTLGLCWMYGSAVGLKANAVTLMYACGDTEAVTGAIAYLEANAIIVYRRFEGAFAFWEGSDVDLPLLYQKALERVGGDSAGRLTKLTNPTPFVARAHYLKTGTLRYFPVHIVDAETDLTQLEQGGSDGDVVFILCSNDAERSAAIKNAKHATEERPDLIIAIPNMLEGLTAALDEAEAWRSLRDAAPELEHDRAARKELSVNLRHADEHLKKVAGGALGLKGYAFTPEASTWLQGGRVHEIKGGRAFQSWLTELCGHIYHGSPPIHNELLNRSNLSTSAKAALNRLVKLIVFGPREYRFGVKGTPPEVSMYEAVLSRGGFHTQEAHYVLTAPSDPNWQATWREVQTFLDESGSGRKPLSELYARLLAPPFGLKAGTLPVILFTALLERPGEVAVYRDGLYQPGWTEELVELVTSVPEKIELQRFRLNQSSQDALRAVQDVLNSFELQSGGSSLLEIAEPLIVSVYKLPQYSRKTLKLSPEVLTLRDALLSATDPNALLLSEMPRLLGVELNNATALATMLKGALSELYSAYPQLLDSVEQQTRAVFGLGANAAEELRERAQPLLAYTVEAHLTLFIKTLSRIEDGDYREALARAVLKGKPSDIWSDADLITFGVSLKRLKSDFVKLEELVAELRETGASRVFRVGVIGDELKDVSANVSLTHEQQVEASELARQVERFLSNSAGVARIKLAAISEAALKLVEEI